MMTNDVSLTGNASSPDAASLPPGPVPAKSIKPEREFSSVMDQAASRKAAHARTTRSASRGRSGEADSATGRERVARSPRSDSPTRAPSRSGKSPAKIAPPGPDADQPTIKADASPMKGATDGAVADDTLAPEDQAAAAVATVDDDTSSTKELTNIVPFPGQLTATALIIPFPLLEAQSVSAVETVQGVAPVTSSSAGATTSESASRANSEEASTGAESRPSPEVVQGDDDFDGIDVRQMGLRPVRSNETMDLPVSGAERTKPAAESSMGSADEEAKIVSVSFRTSAAAVPREREVRGSHAEQSHLPGEMAARVESAPSGALSESSAKIVLLRTDAGKAPADADSSKIDPAGVRDPETAGTSVARQDVRMVSTTSKRESATAEQEEHAIVRPPDSAAVSTRDSHPALVTVPVRGLAGHDWQTSRTLNDVSRSDSSVNEVKATDSTGTVERISNLITRETALVKKHGSDSMAVVLRPDAETELFVHLSQSNGQVEATIRCERGDLHQLGAVWSQLQDSLAQQKIRLAPLQEAAGGNSNFNQSSGGSMTSGGQNGAREEARPEKQSMDDWPAPAAPASPAPHVRGAGGSRRRRITTSRPGWETWA